MEFWLGFMTGAWGFTVALVGYVLWRYCYAPWKVMRKDIVALVAADTATNKRVDDLQHALSPTKISVMSDEQLASIENRLRNARRSSGTQS